MHIEQLRRFGLALAACTATTIVALSGQSAPLSQTPGGTGLIVGQVVDAATRRGIADVAVTAVLSDDVRLDANAGSHAILSDADGQFVLRGVPPGNYRV